MSCYSDHCDRDNENNHEKAKVCAGFQPSRHANFHSIRNLIEQHHIQAAPHQKLTSEYVQRQVNENRVYRPVIQNNRSRNFTDETNSLTSDISNQRNQYADADGHACLKCKTSPPQHHGNQRQAYFVGDTNEHVADKHPDVVTPPIYDNIPQPPFFASHYQNSTCETSHLDHIQKNMHIPQNLSDKISPYDVVDLKLYRNRDQRFNCPSKYQGSAYEQLFLDQNQKKNEHNNQLLPRPESNQSRVPRNQSNAHVGAKHQCPEFNVDDSSAYDTVRPLHTQEREDNNQPSPREKGNQSYQSPKQCNPRVGAEHQCSQFEVNDSQVYDSVRQPPIKVQYLNQDNADISKLPPLPLKQRTGNFGVKHQRHQSDFTASSNSTSEKSCLGQKVADTMPLSSIRSPQPCQKHILKNVFQPYAEHNQRKEDIKNEEHQNFNVSKPAVPAEEGPRFSIRTPVFRQKESEKLIENQNKFERDKHSQSHNSDTTLIEDSIPHIKPPQFRRLSCQKLVHKERKDDGVSTNQQGQTQIFDEAKIEDAVTIKPSHFRRLLCDTLIQNQKIRDTISNQRLSEDPVLTIKQPQIQKMDPILVEDPVPPIRPPDFQRHQWEDLSNRNADQMKLKEKVENMRYAQNLSIAMQNFQATAKALKSGLKFKPIDEDRTAVNVTNEKINGNPIEIKCLQGKIPNIIPRVITNNERYQTNRLDKEDQTLHFKVNRKPLINVVSLLSDSTLMATGTSNVNKLKKILENIPKESELFVNINIQLSDKEQQKSVRHVSISSSVSEYSEMSDRSYITANFPIYRDTPVYTDMSEKRPLDFTKVIIEKEFNMPDRKHNGLNKSFKIESRTYYDQNLNPRIERVSCSMQSASKDIQPKYQYVFEELIQTEYSYLMGLSHMYKDYVLHFRKNPTKRLANMSPLFSIIEDLFNSQSAFYTTLNEHVDNMEDLAKCFIENEKLFYLYKHYIMTMNISKKNLGIEFQADIESRQQELGIPLSFENYMLTPVQRLTRYVLLLEKMNAESEAEGYKCTKLLHAIDFLKKLAASTDVDVEVIQSIENIPENINRFGRFLMKNVFNVKRKCSLPKCMVLLFEQIIIFTAEVQPGRYEYKDSICMNNVYIRAIAENPLCFELLDYTTFSGKGLLIQDKMKSEYLKNLFILEANNLKIKECWVEVIESLLWEQLLMCKKKSPEQTTVNEKLL